MANLIVTDQLVAQRDVFGNTLVELIDRDPRTYVLDGDLANSTKADIVSKERPDHFLEMGIAEQNMMGVAAGMASCGLIPWLSSFAVFLVNRDLDQLRVVVAQPNLNVKIGAGYTGLLTGKTGKTHQEVSDIAIMRAMPNLTVLAPADGVETRQAMLAANEWEGPVYLRLTRDPHPTIFDADHDFRIGAAYIVREGTDVTIMSTGVQTVRALRAADLLAASNRLEEREKARHAPLHDPSTLIALLRPDLFEGRKARVSVVMEEGDRFGKTVPDYCEDGHILWYTKVDADAAFSELLGQLGRYPG